MEKIEYKITADATNLSESLDKVDRKLDNSNNKLQKLNSGNLKPKNLNFGAPAAIQELDSANKKMTALSATTRVLGRGGGRALSPLMGFGRVAMATGPLVGGLVAASGAAIALGQHIMEVSDELYNNKVAAERLLISTGAATNSIAAQGTAIARTFKVGYEDVLKTATSLSGSLGVATKPLMTSLSDGFLIAGANAEGMTSDLNKNMKALTELGLNAQQQIALAATAQAAGGMDKIMPLLNTFKGKLSNWSAKTKKMMDDKLGSGFATSLQKQVTVGQITTTDAMAKLAKGLSQSGLAGKDLQLAMEEIFGTADIQLAELGGLSTSLGAAAEEAAKMNPTLVATLARQQQMTAEQIKFAKNWGPLKEKIGVLIENAQIGFYKLFNTTSTLLTNFGSSWAKAITGDFVGAFQDGVQGIKNMAAEARSEEMRKSTEAGIEKYRELVNKGQDVTKIDAQILKIANTKLGKFAQNIYGTSSSELLDVLKGKATTKPKQIDGTTSTTAASKINNDIASIGSGGKEVKHITINIQRLNGIENVSTTSTQEAFGAATKSIQEEMLKMVQGLEEAMR